MYNVSHLLWLITEARKLHLKWPKRKLGVQSAAEKNIDMLQCGNAAIWRMVFLGLHDDLL